VVKSRAATLDEIRAIATTNGGSAAE
jgi:hypothetical protein